MKKILTILFILSSSLIYSQATLTDLNLVFDIIASNNITSSTFEVQGAVFHSTTEYSGSDVQVGDLVYFQDGPTTYSLPIQSITSQTYSYVTLVLADESSTVEYVPTGRAAIVSVSDPNLLPVPPDGIPADLAAGILNDLRLKIQIGVNNAEEITDYTGALDVAPAYSPSSHTGETWRNSIGQLFYSDGTNWVTDKEVLLTNTSLLNQASGRYKIGVDTSGIKDIIYISNNNVFKKLEVGGTLIGEVITVSDTTVLDTVNRVQFYQYPILAGGERILTWNDTDGTLEFGMKGGNVTQQIGQELPVLVKHADNAGLENGKVVYIAGSNGSNKTVRYAQSNVEATSAGTFGVMTESSTGGNKAFCTTFGLVRNVNTSNLTEGKVIWLSADTAGAMTAVRPIAPKHGVMVGFCIRKHATQGIIFVEVQNGYELNELHDVHTPNPTDNQVLTWNSANSRWEAETLPDISSTNELQTISVASNTVTLSNSGGSVTIAGGGINTVGTSGTTITVTGTEVDGSITNELQTLSTNSTPGNITLSSGNTITLNVNDADASTTNELQQVDTFRVNSTNLELSLTSDNQSVRTVPLSSIVTGGGGLTGNGVAGYLPQYNTASTLDTSGVFWNATTGRLGIGTASPTSRLTVDGTVEFENPSSSFDGGIIGSELLTTGTGAGWTGSSFIAGYKHDSLTTALVSSFTPANNTIYQVLYSVTGRTAGSFTFTFGGFTSAAISTNVTDVNVSQATTSTGALTITPTANFNGTVVFSIKAITAGSPTFVGKNASGVITYEQRYSSSNTNIIQGASAGARNTTGINNVFIGLLSGNINTTGSNNFFLGTNAGRTNTTGGNNLFIGTNSGRSNTLGASNTYIGTSAGFSGITSTENVFIGENAGSNNLRGQRTVAIGADAARLTSTGNNTRADNSIMIGYRSRPLDTAQVNQIVIGYDIAGLGSNTTVLGNSSTTQTWLGGSLTLGTQITPLARLHVAGASALNTGRAVLVTNNATTPLNLFEVRNAGEIYFNQYPNTLNTSGNPVNVLSTGADGVLQSHPISEVISSGGAPTGSGANGQVTFWTGTSTQSGDGALTWDNTNKSLFVGQVPSSTIVNSGINITANNGLMSVYRFENSNAQPSIIYAKSRGTITTPSSVQSGDLLGSFGFNGRGPTDWMTDRAFFGGQVSGTVTSTNLPSSIYFKVGQTATPYVATMYIHHSNKVRIGGSPNITSAFPEPNATFEVLGAGSTASTWTAQFHNNSTNNALMIRDDGNIGIGTNAPSTPLHVRGTGGSPSGRTWIRVENTGTNSGSGFQLQNANGRTAVMQYTGSAYATGESFSIGTSSDYPVNFGTNGDGLSGGSAAITFSPGGYDPSNEVMRILPSKQIAINTTTPNASAVLDITSTTRGVLFPRMTTAQRNLITTPADGLMVYNTSDAKFNFRENGAWNTIPNLSGSGVANQVTYWSGTNTLAGSNSFKWLNSNGSLRLNVNSDTMTTSIYIGESNSNNNGAIWVRNSHPGIVQEAVRASGGVSYNFSQGYFRNSTTNLRTKTHEIGVLGNMETGTTPPSVSYMYFGSHSNVAFDNTALRVYPSKLITTDAGLSVGTTSSSARLHVVGADESTSNWTAQFHNSTGTSNSLMIRNDGNVGIGVGSPSTKFEVNSTSDGLLAIFRRAGATKNSGLYLYTTEATGEVQLRATGSSGDQFLTFFTTSNERVRITNAGLVGIATSAPARTLHVVGEVRITDLSTDPSTKLVGADADGDLDDVFLGESLVLSGGVLDITSAAAVNASEVIIESSTATTIDLDVSGNVKTIDGGNATFVYPTNLSRLAVYKNGVRLTRSGTPTPARDFSVNTTTNEITFTTALVSTDRIVIVKL